MKLSDIFATTPYKFHQGDNCDTTNLTIDSRSVGEGSLFFCIHGLRSNGHDFIATAAAQGACAIVVDEPQPTYPPGVTIVSVANTRVALGHAAANFSGNPAHHFKLVGVTGTNGKTSTCHFIESVLTHWGKKTGIIGTVETRIGAEKVPISFAASTTPDAIELQQIFAQMKDASVSHVAMEVSSHALTLHKTQGITFDVGVFTNLTQDHLDFHGSMASYAHAKAQLFTQCTHGVFNRDDPACKDMLASATCATTTFSLTSDSDLQGTNLVSNAQGVAFDVSIFAANGHTQTVHFHCPIPGQFTAYNMLATIGTCLALDVPIGVIQEAFAIMKGVPGRIQSVPNQKGFTVIVDYAHTPDGLANILSTVASFTTGKLICVFGCGGDRDHAKRPIMGKIAGELSHHCIITSDNPRNEPPTDIIDQVAQGVAQTTCPYEKITDRKEAIFKAIAMAQKGDSVVIAGKGHESTQQFATHTIPFDDCLIAAQALEVQR